MLAQSSLILWNIALWWDVFDTCLLLGLTLIIWSVSCLSSCTSQPLRIGVLLSNCFAISVVVCTTILFFIITLYSCFMLFWMSIGQTTKMISCLLVHSFFILVVIPFLGALRTSAMLLVLLCLYAYTTL